MNLIQPNLVLIDQYKIPTLELDLSKITAPPEISEWKSLIEKITSEWVIANKFEGTATLWMWQSHSQRFHADGISAYVNQCGLPSLFLKYLQRHLKKYFGNQLEYVGNNWILVERGWRPLLHIENEKVWKPRDEVAASWIEV
ncbi:MAG: hypothetical protein OEX07_03230 [Gammaproteobacteria bacterium]|nr:hypothetical protein [Gammaproteobacteria bacterium]